MYVLYSRDLSASLSDVREPHKRMHAIVAFLSALLIAICKRSLGTIAGGSIAGVLGLTGEPGLFVLHCRLRRHISSILDKKNPRCQPSSASSTHARTCSSPACSIGARSSVTFSYGRYSSLPVKSQFSHSIKSSAPFQTTAIALSKPANLRRVMLRPPASPRPVHAFELVERVRERLRLAEIQVGKGRERSGRARARAMGVIVMDSVRVGGVGIGTGVRTLVAMFVVHAMDMGGGSADDEERGAGAGLAGAKNENRHRDGHGGNLLNEDPKHLVVPNNSLAVLEYDVNKRSDANALTGLVTCIVVGRAMAKVEVDAVGVDA